jgi:hypothetical protein
VLAACGSDDDDSSVGLWAGARVGPDAVKPKYPYPPRAVEAFVDTCAPGARQRPVCVCTIERLQRTLPYRDFAAADAATRAGRPVAPRTQRTFDLAAAECRDAG